MTLFPGRVGGSESNVTGLVERFVAGDGPEHVTVLANRHVAAAYAGRIGGPVAMHEVRSYKAGDHDATRLAAMLGARLLPRLAARDVPQGLDVIHYPVTVPIPATDRPTVVTLHDVQHHDLPHFFGRGERAFRRWAYDRSAREATLVVTSSEFSRGRIAERVGVDPERIEVIPLGIDRERFSPDPLPNEQELLAGLSLPRRFVVFPANMWPHKNHQRLVRGLAACADRELCLLLTGQTYGRLEPLTELARELGVADRVRHLGYLPADALPALYRAAAGMVFPSLYEGFGTPPLEAMACGCPVAVSTAGSLPEVCGEDALQFDPKDPESIAAALERLSSDEPLRSRLAEDGPRQAALYDWGAVARRHREVYVRAAGMQPGPDA